MAPSIGVSIYGVSTSVAEDRNIFVLELSSDRYVVQGSFSYSANATPFVEALSPGEKSAAISTWVYIIGIGLGGGAEAPSLLLGNRSCDVRSQAIDDMMQGLEDEQVEDLAKRDTV